MNVYNIIYLNLEFGDCTVLISKSNSKEKLLLKEYTYTDE